MAGENPEPSKLVTSFACPSCGAPIEIRAKGLTVVAVCSACGSLSENNNGTFALIKKALQPPKVKPRIALGTKGKLRGRLYQVIGFLRKSEREYPDEPWDEYLLFNPYFGYAWLAESKGHWTLFRMTKSVPDPVVGGQIRFGGKSYDLYHQGNAQVDAVVGEFYWQVRVGDKTETVDAIHPPFMLSKEEDKDEIVWSLGEYLPPSEVKTAFHVDPMPPRDGIAPNEPSGFAGSHMMWQIWGCAVLSFCLLHFFVKPLSPKQVFPGQTIAVPKTGVTDVDMAHFTTTAASSAMLLNVNSTIRQTWASLHFRVVSDTNTDAATYEFEKDLSYYSGTDGGESWSEGSTGEEFLVNTLPPGNYRVLMSATPEPGHEVQIAVYGTVNPFIWSNLWLALFLISIPAIWTHLRSRSFERRRWQDSEYGSLHSSTPQSWVVS